MLFALQQIYNPSVRQQFPNFPFKAKEDWWVGGGGVAKHFLCLGRKEPPQKQNKKQHQPTITTSCLCLPLGEHKSKLAWDPVTHRQLSLYIMEAGCIPVICPHICSLLVFLWSYNEAPKVSVMILSTCPQAVCLWVILSLPGLLQLSATCFIFQEK